MLLYRYNEPMNAPRTARERARAELTAEILAAARRQLAEDGAAMLSLRSVARELGMVSSAVYRYFASRDELLTALIVQAYTEIGEAAEGADRRGDTLEERWLAVWRGVRAWSLAHRHEYALIFGTPVPGYLAPHITIEVAGRMPLTLARIVADAKRSGNLTPTPGPVCPAEAINPDMLMLLEGERLAPDEVARLIFAWNRLVGVIGYELHGHLVNVTADDALFFDHTARTEGAYIGLSFR